MGPGFESPTGHQKIGNSFWSFRFFNGLMGTRMAQATLSCCCAAIHLEGDRAKRGKKVSGGHFFSPWESPRSSERIPQGCGRSSGIAEGDSNASNPTRRGRVGGEGSTEPNLYFRPFPGENANESLTGHQAKNSFSVGVCRGEHCSFAEERSFSDYPKENNPVFALRRQILLGQNLRAINDRPYIWFYMVL